ncbi:hypothetical protein OAM69_06615 [bacterium]|nr:hypothetical protein [bacterium]
MSDKGTATQATEHAAGPYLITDTKKQLIVQSPSSNFFEVSSQTVIALPASSSCSIQQLLDGLEPASGFLAALCELTGKHSLHPVYTPVAQRMQCGYVDTHV